MMIEMNTNPDLVIVRSLLESIAARPTHGLRRFTKQLNVIRARLEAGDESASMDFWCLARNGAFEGDLIESVSDRAIEFVSRELAKLSDIRAERPLTDDEKRFAGEVLFRLLDSLKSFFESEEES